jgi:Cd2+/Zn2+-exporting ATPase
VCSSDLVALGGNENELLALAAAVETRSDHPLARAVVDAARERGLRWDQVTDFESVAGRGIRARYGDRRVAIGSLRLFASEGVDIAVVAQVERLENAGRTTMVVRIDSRYAGVIGLMDTARAGIPAVLSRLRRLGITKMTLLTGDNQRVAEAVAREVGLTDVRAGLMPEDKVTAIAEIVGTHGAAAMVGDGVNDAPALARATVGIAMGGAGSDVALETADIALMGDDLSKLPFAIALGRAARAAIRQNLIIALGVVALLLPATLFGVAGIGTAVLLHEGSTVLVVLNALRLLAFHDPTADSGPIRP